MAKSKPVGRPCDGDTARTERVALRLTPSEREGWEREAGAEERSLGTWIRLMVERGRKVRR